MSQTSPQPESESILVADCGSTRTKVVLLDVVSGQYRFVAYAESPSTGDDTWDDVSVGVVSAIREIERATGQQLLDHQEQLIRPQTSVGQGVDRFLVVSSAVRPLRMVLVGLSRDVSLSSARRAALTTYSQIVDELALEQDVDLDRPRSDDDKINALWHASPEVVCVVGGTDGGAAEPVIDVVHNVVRVALYLSGANVPTVIFAGNAKLRDVVTADLGEVAPLHIVDNVRPSPEMENIGPLSEEIEICFYDLQLKYLPGSDVLRDWGAPAVLPTARTADYTTRYCDRAWNPAKPALSVDVGSASTTLNVCQGGHPLTTVRSDLGVGFALLDLLEQVDLSDILRWLPFELAEDEARDRLMNKALKPHSVPQTRADMLLEQGVAREAIRLALRDLWPGWRGRTDGLKGEIMIPACDPIVAGGGIMAHVPYHGHAVLMLLDALQPLGVSELYLDEYNLMPSLGAVASVHPLAMVQTLRSGGLTFMGTVVVPSGHAQPGSRALTIRPVDKTINVSTEVAYGNLAAIPFQFFAPGTMLELIPARNFDVGMGPGKSLTMTYKSGTVGLIVDARGRPLDLSGDPERQRQRMDLWLWEMMSA